MLHIIFEKINWILIARPNSTTFGVALNSKQRAIDFLKHYRSKVFFIKALLTCHILHLNSLCPFVSLRYY